MGAQPVRRPVPGHRPQPGPQALLRVQLPGVGPQGQEYVSGQLLHVLPGALPGQHPHHDGAHIGGEAVDGPLQGQAAALPELLCQRDRILIRERLNHARHKRVCCRLLRQFPVIDSLKNNRRLRKQLIPIRHCKLKRRIVSYNHNIIRRNHLQIVC